MDIYVNAAGADSLLPNRAINPDAFMDDSGFLSEKSLIVGTNDGKPFSLIFGNPTFLKYVKECDVRLHKDDLVQTHNPRGLTERHAAATDAARNLNHDQDAPDSPLRDR